MEVAALFVTGNWVAGDLAVELAGAIVVPEGVLETAGEGETAAEAGETIGALAGDPAGDPPLAGGEAAAGAA